MAESSIWLRFLLYTFAFVFSHAQEQVSCGLKWEPEGYGNVPPCAIECGSNDFVARVFQDNQWLPGRMTPSKGTAFITNSGTVYTYDTYEILTNPDNCILDWAPGHGGFLPDNAVKVNELPASPQVYIGRGSIAGMTLGGKVVPSESAIFIAYESKEVTRRDYEVLRSFYPKLVGKIENFKFDRSNLAKGETEMIGQEEISNKFNAELIHTVNHGKTVQERFTLRERYNWTGISKLSFVFPVWYGSSDVKGEFELETIGGDELTVVRDRDMSTSRNVNVKAGSGSTTHHIQVCSTITIVENLIPAIPFRATGIFSADGMTGIQVSYILRSLGRTVQSVNGNEVSADVEGTLNGRFALYASSFVQVAENPICNSYNA